MENDHKDGGQGRKMTIVTSETIWGLNRAVGLNLRTDVCPSLVLRGDFGYPGNYYTRPDGEVGQEIGDRVGYRKTSQNVLIKYF